MKNLVRNATFVFVLCLTNLFALENTALVIVDMQDQFFERGNNQDSDELKILMKNNMALTKWAVENDLPVLVFEYEGYGPTTETLEQIYLSSTYRAVLKSADGGFNTYSDSREEALEFLRHHNIKELIVSGINGPYCVYSTLSGALDLEFKVHSSSDTVADFNTTPPTLPSNDWWFEHDSFYKYKSYEEIISKFSEVQNQPELDLAATGS
jgi:nicotinamidase-related amidase